MQRKLRELHLDVEGLPDSLNTHGTEIAPRSYVVGEYLEHLCGHRGNRSFSQALAGIASLDQNGAWASGSRNPEEMLKRCEEVPAEHGKRQLVERLGRLPAHELRTRRRL